MLVDLVLLRDEGAKLPRERLLAMTPARGHLEIKTFRYVPTGMPGETPVKTEATFREKPDDRRPAAWLVEAHVTVIDGDRLIVTGKEVYGHPSLLQKRPQAWWCRLVPE